MDAYYLGIKLKCTGMKQNCSNVHSLRAKIIVPGLDSSKLFEAHGSHGCFHCDTKVKQYEWN